MTALKNVERERVVDLWEEAEEEQEGNGLVLGEATPKSFSL
jgi:hypothetical protein